MTRQTAGIVSFALLVIGSLAALAVSIVPTGRGAIVTVLEGSASVRSGAVLSSGDHLRTGSGSVAMVRFPGGSVTRLDGGSDLKLLRITPSVEAELSSGASWTHVVGSAFTQRLPGAISVSIGAGRLQVNVGPLISLTVWSGSAQLVAAGQRHDVQAGSRVTITGKDMQTAPVSDKDRSQTFTVLKLTLDALVGASYALAGGTLAAGSESKPQRLLLADGTTDLELTMGSSVPGLAVTLTDPGGNPYPARTSIVTPLSLVLPKAAPGLWAYVLRNSGDQEQAWWLLAGWRPVSNQFDKAAATVASFYGSRSSAIASQSGDPLAALEAGAPLLADREQLQLARQSQNYELRLFTARGPRQLRLGVNFPATNRPLASSIDWPNPRTQRFLAVSQMDDNRHELRLFTASSPSGPWRSDFAVFLDANSPDPVFASVSESSARAASSATDTATLLSTAMLAAVQGKPAPSDILKDSWTQSAFLARQFRAEHLRGLGLQVSVSYSGEQAPGDAFSLADGRPLAFVALREVTTVTAGGSCFNNPLIVDVDNLGSGAIFPGVRAGRYRSITTTDLVQLAAVLPVAATPRLQLLGYDDSIIAISATSC